MAREGYRLWFGKCNDFNLHGVFSRDWLPILAIPGSKCCIEILKEIKLSDFLLRSSAIQVRTPARIMLYYAYLASSLATQ